MTWRRNGIGASDIVLLHSLRHSSKPPKIISAKFLSVHCGLFVRSGTDYESVAVRTMSPSRCVFQLANVFYKPQLRAIFYLIAIFSLFSIVVLKIMCIFASWSQNSNKTFTTMKHLTFWRNIFVMVAAIFFTSCSNSDNDQEKPFTTDPVEQTKFFVC